MEIDKFFLFLKNNVEIISELGNTPDIKNPLNPKNNSDNLLLVKTVAVNAKINNIIRIIEVL